MLPGVLVLRAPAAGERGIPLSRLLALCDCTVNDVWKMAADLEKRWESKVIIEGEWKSQYAAAVESPLEQGAGPRSIPLSFLTASRLLLFITRGWMGSAQLRRHLLQDLCGTHTARNSQFCLLEEPVWIGLELPVNINIQPQWAVIRVLLPRLSVVECVFSASKPAGSSTDVLVVGRDFQQYKKLKRIYQIER